MKRNDKTGLIERDSFITKTGGIALAVLLILSLCAFGGCSSTGTLHKPTTAANAGTSALVAYAVAGAAAGQYLALPLCAATPVYPCKTQAINDKLALADTAAYTAAKAADAAGDAKAAQPKIDALADAVNSPEVKTQTDLAAKKGATP